MMDIATVIDLAREALWMTILISAPLLGVALVAGVLIGVIQAATSINEMTLSFIPKLAALALVIAIVGGWQIGMMVDYTRRIFERIPTFFS
jgi:flagellar biosynthetic protein FliQ